MKRVKIVVTMALITILSVFLEDSMALGTKLVLFSEVHGVVVDRGTPISGAQLKRWYNWAWNDKEGIDYAKSDKDGNFHFDSITVTSFILKFIPHQPVITQKIDLIINNKVYKAWSLVKMDYDNNGELDGKRIKIICDIAAEPGFKGKFYGISRIP